MWTINATVKLLMVILIAVAGPELAVSAEVRGSVEFVYNGIFNTGADTRNQPVAVALLPVGNRQIPQSKAAIHHMEIADNRIQPSFLTAQRGDRVIFVNTDTVYHQLFSLSKDVPFDVTLGKADSGKPKQASLELEHAGTVHIFCRIHNKSYARLDVLETPYQQMITAGQPFYFSKLQAGRWMLRLASPVAETRLIPVDAISSPPPLRLELASHGGGATLKKLGMRPAIEGMYQ